MRALLIGTVFLLALPAAARADVPTSYITEAVDASYNADGSLQQPVAMVGYVEVGVPNEQDVLQYLIMDMSSTAGTNMQSTRTYNNVAASPNAGDRTRMYINTTTGESNISYEISPSVAPVIYLDMDYSNAAGGHDVYSGGTNTFGFNVTVNSTHTLSSVTMDLRFSRNMMGSADSFNMYGVGSSSGVAARQDQDTDGYYDTIHWSGSLGSGDAEIWFTGDTEPGTNFDESAMSVNLDQGTTSQAVFQDSTQTFTGVTFSDRFSRGPVREGIDMMNMGTWAVRGFIRNIATDIDYRIHGWELFRVGESDSLINSTQEIYPFSPDTTEYTEWYDTGEVDDTRKADYYTVSWNWEVEWGSSYYSRSSQGTVTLPVLYEIDSWADKSLLTLSSPSEGVSSISVQDLARHIGHSNLEVEQVTINSILPRMSSTGASNTWTPSGITVVFENGSGEIDITSQSVITTQAAGASDGYVNAYVPDIEAAIGRAMEQNEDVRLEFTATGTMHTTTQNYTFCQYSTLVTASGTPVTESACDDVIVASYIPPEGPEEPGGGGGGGGAGPETVAYDAYISRETGEGYFVADNLAKVVARYNIIDTGTVGVKDIRSFIYVPEHGSLDTTSVVLRIYDSSSGKWEEWEQGADYEIEDRGTTTVEGKVYREYVLSKILSGGIFEEGMQLFNGDKMEITYMTTVPVGSSMFLTRVTGYNYYKNTYMFEDLYVPFRRDGTVQDPDMSEGEWKAEKIYVGTPVSWLKTIEVYNPNNVSIEHAKRMDVFPDSLSAYLIQQGVDRQPLELREDDNTFVNVIFSLGPGERKTYLLEVTTPPVIEIGRVVDVVESSESEIKFMVNITVEDFGQADYSGISLLFGVENDKIIQVTEDGVPMYHTEFDESTTEIFLGDMKHGWRRGISILYSEVPPILLNAMELVMHGCNDDLNMTVFIVPAGRETSSYLEVEIVGPHPELKTRSAQLFELRDMWPWEETEVPVMVDTSTFPDGKYSVYTMFKKDFQTILSSHTEFYIDCPERGAVTVSWIGFLGVAVCAIAYIVLRSWRRKKSDDMGIREKIKKI